MCTRVRQGTAYARARTLVGAACYTEVLYRLTVGNRREAEESLSGAAAWLWLSYIINLSLSASLPLPRVPVLSSSLPFSLSLSCRLSLANPPWWLPSAFAGRLAPRPPHPQRALSAAAAPLDLPYTRPSSQSGVAGSFRASKRIKSYGRERLDLRSLSWSLAGTFRSLLVSPVALHCVASHHSGTTRELPFPISA